MKLTEYNDMQKDFETNVISFDSSDLQAYIKNTDIELQFRIKLTIRMSSIAREMYEKRYINVEELQTEFDTTYEKLKALRI
jgi:hypothetical protein